jgi:hypothetical protein
VQTVELISDLEKGLAAAKELAAQGEPAKAVGQDGPPEPDTSQMPGGVDSAPVSATEPAPVHEPTDAELQKDFAPVEHAAEIEGLDLLEKLKDGHTVKEVASLLHSIESSTAAESIVKAIGDLAQGVRI